MVLSSEGRGRGLHPNRRAALRRCPCQDMRDRIGGVDGERFVAGRSIAAGSADWTGVRGFSISPTLPGAQVAQLVEHVTENHGVGGSIPPLGTSPSFPY